MTTVETILEQRGKTHGDWSEQARLSQSLKSLVAASPNANSLSEGQLEALELICMKISRICVGDFNTRDHWDDIAGYAKLGSKSCDRLTAS